jgi:hypothetical protein
MQEPVIGSFYLSSPTLLIAEGSDSYTIFREKGGCCLRIATVPSFGEVPSLGKNAFNLIGHGIWFSFRA